MPEIAYIGNGTCRLTLTTKAQRRRLEKLPLVEIVDKRAIFPKEMSGNVLRALRPKRRPKADARQTEMDIVMQGGPSGRE